MKASASNDSTMNEKLLSPWTFFICAVGLGINYLVVQAVNFWQLPLYLDTIGAVLAAVFGGCLPGMFVGFLFNIINIFSNPLSLYYGILTILIALSAGLLSRTGRLRSFKGFLLLMLIAALIGGSLGSCVTWVLSGEDTANLPFASFTGYLHGLGLSRFWAQFVKDTLVDFPDKFLTVLPVYFLTRFYPHCLYGKFPLSFMYDGSVAKPLSSEEKPFHVRLRSINFSVESAIVGVSALIGIASASVGFVYYRNQMLINYRGLATDASRLVSAIIPGDRIKEFIANGENVLGYDDIKRQLQHIFDSMSGLGYVSVCAVCPDGNHVVFDLDTKDDPGDKAGTVVPFDDSFSQYKEQLLAGKSIPPLVTKDNYGPMITAYAPVFDNSGHTAAYAIVGIPMKKYTEDLLVYAIKSAALIFGLVILFAAFSLWFVQRKLIDPIHTIVQHSRCFKASDPGKWLQNPAWLEREDLHSGDEIEELYATVCETEEEIAQKVIDLRDIQLKLQESAVIEQKNRELAVAVQSANEANAAKTTFLSNMSHDIRTPLNVIIGMVHLAGKEKNPPRTVDCLGKVNTSSRFLLGLVNDILDMAKAESNKVELHPEPYPVKVFYDYLDAMIYPLCREKNQNFIVSPSPSYGFMPVVDTLRVNQIFFNLLSNAVKYTREGGTISCHITNRITECGRFHIMAKISDNGIGMSESFQKHLFEPFVQEHRSDLAEARGTGLGLAIVKRMVTLMGGTVSVSSKLGEGSTFTVNLEFDCVSEKQTETQTFQLKGDKDADYSVLSGRHVLLCEDHPLNREIAQALLADKGMTVKCVENGQLGVMAFRSSPVGFFDAVLMDVRMPVMNGFEATKAIRALPRADAQCVPIIAMTADAFEEDVKKCLASGMNTHIAKPFEPEKLYRTILNSLPHR